MAETFVILERAGNGYLMKSTEGRGDQEELLIRMRVDLSPLPGPSARNLEIDTGLDDTYDLILGGTRIKTPAGPGGGHTGSTTATIRQENAEFNPSTHTWWVYVDYILADPTDDVCDVTIAARKHELTGHVTLIK